MTQVAVAASAKWPSSHASCPRDIVWGRLGYGRDRAVVIAQIETFGAYAVRRKGWRASRSPGFLLNARVEAPQPATASSTSSLMSKLA